MPFKHAMMTSLIHDMRVCKVKRCVGMYPKHISIYIYTIYRIHVCMCACVYVCMLVVWNTCTNIKKNKEIDK